RGSARPVDSLGTYRNLLRLEEPPREARPRAPRGLRLSRFHRARRRAAADPFRPRLRRRGAGLADERAAGPDSEPGQEIPAQADPLPGKSRALPGLPGGRAR